MVNSNKEANFNEKKGTKIKKKIYGFFLRCFAGNLGWQQFGNDICSKAAAVFVFDTHQLMESCELTKHEKSYFLRHKTVAYTFMIFHKKVYVSCS